ncbi:hypothetical protein XENOCAPTIV_027275 [Xenoophorus captivus]|uniref:Uncharacterized protein n=1 Tax=Xenoophorus captivus TaxID=1517983 RepID=A0ABV0RBB1_9TELE
MENTPSHSLPSSSSTTLCLLWITSGSHPFSGSGIILTTFNLQQELLLIVYMPSFSLSCLRHLSVVWLIHKNRTGPYCNKQSGLQRGSSGSDLPSIQGLYRSMVRKRAANIFADPKHTAHNLFYLQVGARELYLEKPATTETVSTLRLLNTFQPEYSATLLGN